MSDNTLADLPVNERIIRTTSTKLVKHFRGLETAGMLDRGTASNLIGCVKKLASVARESQESPNISK